MLSQFESPNWSSHHDAVAQAIIVAAHQLEVENILVDDLVKRQRFATGQLRVDH